MAGILNATTGVVSLKNPDAGTANFSGTVKNVTSFDIVDKNGFLIGYITQFNPSKTRATERIRHISSADAGRVLEQAPRPEDISINITGYSLYNDQEDGSLVQRLVGSSANISKAFASLEEQKEGFDIIVVTRDPETKKAVDVKIYQDVWLQNQNEPINIAQATVQETATGFASRCLRPKNYEKW